MEVTNYKGYVIRLARQTGGKAGKGCNKTSTLQVFTEGGSVILKSFRFKVGNMESARKAAQKARAYVDSMS